MTPIDEKTPHIPVLLTQTLESFASIKEGVVIDCTLGYGGHTGAILSAHPEVTVLGIDRDSMAINFATQKLAGYGSRFRALQGDFAATFAQALDVAGVKNVRAILADIGVSSLQLDFESRGFGFESDVLDMRMDQTAPLSAYEVVNEYSEEALAHIFKTYGELVYAKPLAKRIVQERTKAPITSAKALSQIAQSFRSNKKIHPATLVFQAIRIEVNDELGQLEGVLDAIEAAPLEDCIVSIITFHSLEDRIVKQRFNAWAQSCICPHDAMRCTCGNNHALGKHLYKKPQSADVAELKHNPRARSAKLRSFIFGPTTV